MSSQSSQRSKPSPLGAGLSEETRKAMSAAFDALSDWRNDLSSITDKNSTAVFDKMGAAAKAMGWPSDFVDMTRQQMQSTSKMQLQMMDQLMDVWEQQMKAPGSPIQMPKMPGVAGFPGAFAGAGGSAQAFPGMPSFPGFDLASMSGNPMQFWMQAAEMWQKSWQQGMTAWLDAVQSGGVGNWPKGDGRR